jgi:hypothetical protein
VRTAARLAAAQRAGCLVFSMDRRGPPHLHMLSVAEPGRIVELTGPDVIQVPTDWVGAEPLFGHDQLILGQLQLHAARLACHPIAQPGCLLGCGTVQAKAFHAEWDQ